ncbi:MAG: aminotransferase class III-fold pyridoxal phosphate-dependent enzyme [Burkholderiaceae bacterium]
MKMLIQRLQLSRAKHPSLAGHVRLSKRVARWIASYQLTEEQALACDGASNELVAHRRAALERLSKDWQDSAPLTIAATHDAQRAVPDMRLTAALRVPFMFSDWMAQRFPPIAFWQGAEDFSLRDLDGNRYIDLTGSYGVNLFGADFYKRTMEQAQAIAAPMGATLGGYQHELLEVITRLQGITGHQQFSFHMSGTEAVMQAVRLARHHTKRRRIVRFAGAYHGWWDDVQPGVGNPMPPGEVLTLRDMHARTLEVLRTRTDIACVLVNPIQVLHPNQNPPTDSTLLLKRQVVGTPDVAGYAQWLKQLRQICSERGIALIFDEVFLGFRLAAGGAQAYFDVQADLVCYGKTLGGGYPLGLVAGEPKWMERLSGGSPSNLVFARGTFNAHPHVVAGILAFLRALEQPDISACYETLDQTWRARAESLNRALQGIGAPVGVRALSTVWTLTFDVPSRFHWLYSYYLKRHGVAVPWTGASRIIWPANTPDAVFKTACDRMVAAAEQMMEDGWCPTAEQRPTNTRAASMRRLLRRELLRAKWPSVFRWLDR